MFNSNEVVEVSNTYIKPGVHENVEVTGISTGEAKSGTPYVQIDFKTPDGLTLEEKLYFSKDGTKYSLRKIIHLFTQHMERAVVDKADSTAKTIGQYATNLYNLIKGKKTRIKFVGEEIEGTEGKQNWIKARLGFSPFAEPMTVSKTDSKLIYNPDNAYDLKKLDTSSTEDLMKHKSSVLNMVDELPFK